MQRSLRRLLLPAGILYLVGGLEGMEVLRQRRHGITRSLVTSRSDLDPASVRLRALTWWAAWSLPAWVLPSGDGLSAHWASSSWAMCWFSPARPA
jgi:hypothetical protein